MKFSPVIILLFLFWCSVPVAHAQTPKLKDDDSKRIIIRMEQKESEGWICCNVSPYIVTLYDNGTVTYEGVEESTYDTGGKPVSTKEIPEKIVVKRAITEKQFTDLLNEFYKIKFHALKDSYASRDNGDGTKTLIKDGGLATVIISLSLYGQTKTIKSYYFAPKELIELQRKVYALSNIGKYITRPAYWLTKYPNYEVGYPRRERYRKVNINPPAKETNGRIDIYKWALLTPCMTTRNEVGKILSGASLITKSEASQVYQLGNERISVDYITGKPAYYTECDGRAAEGTVSGFSVYEFKDVYLSQLNVDISKFKAKLSYPANRYYYNEPEGISIQTRMVEFSNKSYGEQVTDIQYFKNYKNKRNDAK